MPDLDYIESSKDEVVGDEENSEDKVVGDVENSEDEVVGDVENSEDEVVGDEENSEDENVGESEDEADDQDDQDDDDEDIDKSDDNDDTEDKADDSTDTTDKPKPKQEKKKKTKTPVPPKRKIGPQKQKKEIHTHLKKAKKFEIRKITRRITMLRNMKGTDEQKAKNNRKVEKLLIEMQAMKEFLIDQLTERMVDIFKGKSEQIYLDIWQAAQEHKDFEKMLQTLSNGTDEDKYKKIAFLRMIASKDIIGKLKTIHSGTNTIKQMSKKSLQKKLRKYNQQTKKFKKRDAPTKTDDSSTENAEEGKTDENSKPRNKIKNKKNKPKHDAPTKTDDSSTENAEEGKTDENSKPSNEIKNKKNKPNNVMKEKSKSEPKPKKSKKFVDPFFLPVDGDGSDNDNDNVSSDEDFSAPALETQAVLQKKKNRMGQRARKQLMERENAKNMPSRPPNKKQFNTSRKPSFPKHKQNDNKKFTDTKTKVDEKLHPSWIAKQKLKAQQGITEFSGTKITFDD